MSEPFSNIIGVCDKHAPKPDPKFHAHSPEFFLGKFVKLAFPAINQLTGNKTKEHMWVKVDKVCERELQGIVSNDPIYLCEYQNGDVIEFNITEIEDLAVEEMGGSI